MATRERETVERNATARRAGQTDGRSPAGEERSLGELVRELSGEGGRLVRQEAELAKAELREKLDTFQHALAGVALGAALLVAAVLVLAEAVNRGLTALLAGVVGLEVAVWLAPLLLGGTLGLIGWRMIEKGKRTLGREGLTPEKTKRSLEEDKRWVEEKVR